MSKKASQNDAKCTNLPYFATVTNREEQENNSQNRTNTTNSKDKVHKDEKGKYGEEALSLGERDGRADC